MFLKKYTLLVILALIFFIPGCASFTSTQPAGERKPIHVLQTSPANMMQMLRNGEIDAFVAWEPYNAIAVQEGAGRYVVQSGQIWPDHPCCVVAISGKAIDEKLALSLVWAHVKATKFINDPLNQEKVIKYAMEFTGKDRATVIDGLAHTKFVNKLNGGEFKRYYNELRESGLMKKNPIELGYADEGTFFADFIISKYVEEIEAKLALQPAWMPPAITTKQKVTLGYINQDLHQIQVYIAQHEGYYRQVGLIKGENLELRQYNNGVAVMEAFKAKELVASYLGGAPATLKRLNDDIAIRIVAGANNEGTAIVARKDLSINSIDQLAGKRVALPAIGTVQHFVLDLAARKSNLMLQVK